jgi:tetratricopeptide (TPR) repeat protein
MSLPQRVARLNCSGLFIWIAYILFILALDLLLYGHLIEQPVLNGDDDHYILQGARLNQDLSNLFAPRYQSPRPLTDLVSWLAYKCLGENAGGFHALIVFLHAAVSVLLAAACRNMGMSREVSLLAGVLFALMVANFRMVFLISGLSYHLAPLCGLAAVIFYVQSEKRNSLVFLSAFSCSLLLGVLSHPAAVFILPFSLFYTYNQTQRILHPIRRLAPAVVLAILAVFCLVYFFPNRLQTYHSIYVPDLAELVKHLLWLPGRLLATAYWLPITIYQFYSVELILGAVVWGGGLVVMWRCKNSHLAVWSCWILVASLPFVNRLPRSFQLSTTGPSQYIHMASIGLAVVLAYCMAYCGLWCRRRFGVVKGGGLYVASLVALAVCSFLAHDSLQAFSHYAAGVYAVKSRNLETGIEQLVLSLETDESGWIISREAAHIWLCRALVLAARPLDGEIDSALREFPESSRLYAIWGALESLAPDSTSRAQGHRKLALAQQLAQDRVDSGKPLVEPLRTLEGGSLNGLVASIYEDIAERLALGGDYAGAGEAYSKQLEYASQRHLVLLNLGTLYAKAGQYDAAINALVEATQLRPNFANGHYNLGLLHLTLGELDAAAAAFAEAVRYKSGTLARYQLGCVLRKLDRHGEAIVALEAVVPQGDPPTAAEHYAIEKLYSELDGEQMADAYFSLGFARNMVGRHREAIDAYQKALSIRPQLGAVQARLAVSLLLVKEPDAAYEVYRGLERLDGNEAAKISKFFDQ